MYYKNASDNTAITWYITDEVYLYNSRFELPTPYYDNSKQMAGHLFTSQGIICTRSNMSSNVRYTKLKQRLGCTRPAQVFRITIENKETAMNIKLCLFKYNNSRILCTIRYIISFKAISVYYTLRCREWR